MLSSSILKYPPWIQSDSSYQATLKNLWPLQSHCDAIEEYEGQHHVVKEFMGNNRLAEQSEPNKRKEKFVFLC